MLNATVSFSVMSSAPDACEEDLKQELSAWLDMMCEAGYTFAVVQVKETLKYEENE